MEIPCPGRALAVVLLVCAIDGADLAVLGAAFHIFEEQLGMGPSTLGKVAMAQAMAMSVTAPIWGWMCDTGFASRRVLWTAGITGWALAMAALAVASSLWLILLIRIANGVFLACMAPLTQSWVAETVPLAVSGRIFGLMHVAGVVGSTVATMLITSFGGSTIVFGDVAISGWRLICAVVSALSLCAAVAAWFVIDGGGEGRVTRHRVSLRDAYIEIACNLREHWRSFTFRMIVYQGVTGGIPWSALAFKIMFLRYVGFSNGQINVFTAAVVVPKVLGGMVGGLLGDHAAQASPRHGRALVGQFAVGCGIPLMFLQIVVFPELIGTWLWPYVLCNFLFCLVASWTPAGVIRPLFLEVVDSKSRASILAWEHALQGVCSTLLGAGFVGFLAEHVFQYHPTKENVGTMPAELRQHNFAALQWSLAVMTTVPWLLCFAAISCLHWSYLYDGAGASKDKAALLGKRQGLSDNYGGAVG